MRQSNLRTYCSPKVDFHTMQPEGVLCSSLLKEYESPINQDYSSSDDLFEIF